jgi:Fic family protein
LIDLSWASSSLEGNTYSLLETEQLLSLKDGFIEGKSPIETQMILNHKEAIKFLILNKSNIKLDERTIKSVHALLGENLLANPAALGALRQIPVGITGTRYTPISTPQLIEEEFHVFLEKINLIEDPLEQSLMTLIFIPYIQPFEDINKRTSRICCNIPLVANNLLPISFKNIQREPYLSALKDVYELNSIIKIKQIFISALEDSAKDYKHIVSRVMEPSLAQMRYRAVIKNVVYKCVKTNSTPRMEDLSSVEVNMQGEVLAEITKELKALHEGSLVRFNLTPSDFQQWRK